MVKRYTATRLLSVSWACQGDEVRGRRPMTSLGALRLTMMGRLP